jgi:hypothetical protein
MRDEKRKKVPGEAADVERELARLTGATVPPGMRQRVLDRATGARRDTALTPGMRGMAVVCSALIAAVLVIDPLIVKHETARLAALLGVPEITEPTARESDSFWAELGVDPGDIDRTLLKGIVASGAKGRGFNLKDHLHARDRLKGMIDYENAEGLN